MNNIIKLADARVKREERAPNAFIVQRLTELLEQAQAGRLQDIFLSAVMYPAPDVDPDFIPAMAFYELEDMTSLEASLLNSNLLMLTHSMTAEMLDKNAYPG